MKTTNQLRKECAALEDASKKGEIKIFSHRRGWLIKGWQDVTKEKCENYLAHPWNGLLPVGAKENAIWKALIWARLSARIAIFQRLV